MRSLAADLSINYNTVSKAYVDLEHSGYVKSIRGRGVFVRETPEAFDGEMTSAVDTVLEDAIRRCLSMGMSLDEVQLRMIDITHEIKKEMKTRLR